MSTKKNLHECADHRSTTIKTIIQKLQRCHTVVILPYNITSLVIAGTVHKK